MKKGWLVSLLLHGLVFGAGWFVLRPTDEQGPRAQVAIDVGLIVVGQSRSGGAAPRPVPVPVPVTAPVPVSETVPVPGTAPGATSGAEVATSGASRTGESVTANLGSGERVLSLLEYIDWVRTHNAFPTYSRQAKLRHDEGRTLVRVVVNHAGAIESVAVEQSSGSELLDHSSLEAVRAWQFPPFKGEQDRLVVKIPFKFSLDDR